MTSSQGTELTPDDVAKYERLECREKAEAKWGMLIGSLLSLTLIGCAIVWLTQ